METVLAVDTEDGSSSSDNDDQVWDDWASEPWTRARCQSLFEQKSFATVPEALEYDKETYGFDLREMCSRLCQYAPTRCESL
jgi:protein arginine N-methyltransferase 3